MDNMLDMRKRMDDGTYDLTLLIGDNTYFNFYESINTDAAKDVVRNYLFDNDDDADYKNVTIDHNKNRHIVTINAKLDYISLTNIISTYCSPSVIDVLVNNLTLREAGKKYNCSAQNIRNIIYKQINKLNLVLLYPNDFDYNYITMSRKQFRIYYMKIHNCSYKLFKSRMEKIKEEYKPINIYILHKGRKIDESYC